MIYNANEEILNIIELLYPAQAPLTSKSDVAA